MYIFGNRFDMPTLKAGDQADVVSTKFSWHVLNANRTIGDKKSRERIIHYLMFVLGSIVV